MKDYAQLRCNACLATSLELVVGKNNNDNYFCLNCKKEWVKTSPEWQTVAVYFVEQMKGLVENSNSSQSKKIIDALTKEGVLQVDNLEKSILDALSEAEKSFTKIIDKQTETLSNSGHKQTQEIVSVVKAVGNDIIEQIAIAKTPSCNSNESLLENIPANLETVNLEIGTNLIKYRDYSKKYSKYSKFLLIILSTYFSVGLFFSIGFLVISIRY